MARDVDTAVKLARDLPQFGEVVKSRKGYIKSLGGNVDGFELVWDLNRSAQEAQVFLMAGQIKIDGQYHRVTAYISKQALEHFLRAV